MVLEQLTGNLLQGLVLGAVYGMATMGLSLIFGVLKVVNVGHGAFIMVGAFVTLWAFTTLGMPPLVAIPLAFLIGMGLGFVFYYSAIKRLIKAPELASLLATFSIGILLEEIVKLIFGSEFRGYNWVVPKIDLGVTVLPMSKLYAFIGSIIIALLLYLWFNKTRAGTAMRSVVEDTEGARVCGVNVGWVYANSFAIGIGLTVASGVLLTMFIPVGINPYMGGGYTLKAFVIAVLGGLSSPYGAFFGGLVFGLIENGSYTLFALIPGVEPFALTRFLSFVMLLIILLIRPTGLLKAK
ncbi:MAG: branched-chain amino acid ABC transporter permease [Deltaproteobacteria bacterium]|nr:branched-chain amino acid ABC transporter permease [Deltaproteobacteria bacterium]MBW1929665.1 branched-chain amino acid ABC transporter permease [Deltaproteobacteria bacterium]MBW2025252.1 branched-chain amino acid ABC transporter permease [Deltaproteobacteria bacterium]MBW2125156.1 branched-chain amino acid ABC transporter permease [Deltaproteobacteria bacterium]RLB24866.1 MAG: branched-chain amino acid ABC transporter permease [Deltaproteobacteria bacterium]